MRIFFSGILFLISTCTRGQDSFQLAPPMLKYNSAFFTGSTSFEIIFNQSGAEVRYTLNGKEPGSKDLLYTGPVKITGRTVVQARAIGEGFIPSETVRAEFIREGKQIKSIGYSRPNEYYLNAKADILHDNIGGQPNFRGGGWLGYDTGTVVLTIDLTKKETINSVLLELLQDENSWIFLPAEIIAYYFDEKKNGYQLLADKTLIQEQPSPKSCKILEIMPRQGAVLADKLKLEIPVLKKIPDWHTAKGNHAWLFIDEVKVY